MDGGYVKLRVLTAGFIAKRSKPGQMDRFDARDDRSAAQAEADFFVHLSRVYKTIGGMQ
jgi:hypothetical protein